MSHFSGERRMPFGLPPGRRVSSGIAINVSKRRCYVVRNHLPFAFRMLMASPPNSVGPYI